MKHCNLPFTKCYPLFCILSNFDTSGREYIHQFVQYSSFLHFKRSSMITCVNILCHTHTTCLIIKIWNDKENKFNMILRNCEMGEKVNWGKKWTQFAWESRWPTEVHTHTLLTAFKYPTKKHNLLMWPTAATAAFDKVQVQVQQIHGQLDHDKFYNKLQKHINMYFPKTI